MCFDLLSRHVDPVLVLPPQPIPLAYQNAGLNEGFHGCPTHYPRVMPGNRRFPFWNFIWKRQECCCAPSRPLRPVICPQSPVHSRSVIREPVIQGVFNNRYPRVVDQTSNPVFHRRQNMPLREIPGQRLQRERRI